MQAVAAAPPGRGGATSRFELIAPATLLAGIEIARIRGFDRGVLVAVCGAAILLGVWRIAARASIRRGPSFAGSPSLQRPHLRLS
jgi:hypothetical protein